MIDCFGWSGEITEDYKAPRKPLGNGIRFNVAGKWLHFLIHGIFLDGLRLDFLSVWFFIAYNCVHESRSDFQPFSLLHLIHSNYERYIRIRHSKALNRDQPKALLWKTFPGLKTIEIKTWNEISRSENENFLLRTQQSECRGSRSEWERNAKPNFLSSSQPLKLIKKPFNFIVMWLAIQYISQYTTTLRQNENESQGRERMKSQSAQKKAIKIKVAEIKSKRRYRSAWMGFYLLVDYLSPPACNGKVYFPPIDVTCPSLTSNADRKKIQLFIL